MKDEELTGDFDIIVKPPFRNKGTYKLTKMKDKEIKAKFKIEVETELQLYKFGSDQHNAVRSFETRIWNFIQSLLTKEQ